MEQQSQTFFYLMGTRQKYLHLKKKKNLFLEDCYCFGVILLIRVVILVIVRSAYHLCEKILNKK